jgi:hypothetical protein
MKILSVRRKIPFYVVFDGSLKTDVATQMFVLINFPAAVTWEFETLSGHVQLNELVGHG